MLGVAQDGPLLVSDLTIWVWVLRDRERAGAHAAA